MGFNWWTFLFEALNFLVLAYVLHRLLYRPLHDAIDARRAAEKRVRDEAEKVRQDALALQARLQQEQGEQEQQRQELLQKSREQAEADRRRILADGEQTAQRRQEELRQALQRDREEALRAVRSEVVRQAVELCGRLLYEAAGADLQDRLAHRLVDALELVPPEECERLGREWAPIDGAVLETASDLEEAVVRPIRSAVDRLLRREVGLTMQTRPELLSGVRLRLGGHVWDASLAGQLEEAGAGRQTSAVSGAGSVSA